MSRIDDSLKQAGVRNLKEYGYPDVNNENIMTDRIYSNFFASMLDDTISKTENGRPAERLVADEAKLLRKKLEVVGVIV